MNMRDTCVNARMVNRYVMKLEHDLFIDCLPYEWQSGMGDGLFLPVYPLGACA